MTQPNIIMTRVDERLIHGQGQLWVKFLNCNTVIVANDAVSEDKIQQSLMKTVIPSSIAIRFFSIQKVIDIIHKASPAQSIFIVVKDLQDAKRLVEGVFPSQKSISVIFIKLMIRLRLPSLFRWEKQTSLLFVA